MGAVYSPVLALTSQHARPLPQRELYRCPSARSTVGALLIRLVARDQNLSVERAIEPYHPRLVQANLNFSPTFRVIVPVDSSPQSYCTPITVSRTFEKFREELASPAEYRLSRCLVEYRRASVRSLLTRSRSPSSSECPSTSPILRRLESRQVVVGYR